MLGKVFEELVTGRHEIGSYYTPKPVVSFMCREALKGYLKRSLTTEQSGAIDRFVDFHDPAALKDFEAVLKTLKEVKVCDPACGSGAYLLGMLHELLDLRSILFAAHHVDPVSAYNRKLEIIQNNVYGVDMDPFAVNIAQLRLWLSLAVEFDGDNPPPLPNLDYKIEAGNSVTGPAPGPSGADSFRDKLLQDFMAAKELYLTAHGPDKPGLRDEINFIKETILGFTTTGSAQGGFDWAVEFAEVFYYGGGFDIVVANPPYVRQELIRDLKPTLQKVFPEVYTGTADLYVFFYARALQILRPGGMLAFISSNKWFRANYGAKLREHIAKTTHVLSITDFGELPVFETAATFPMIFVAQKAGASSEATLFTQVKSLQPPYPEVLTLMHECGQRLPQDALNGATWTLAGADSASQLRRMESSGIPLGEYVKGKIYYGVKTGFNTAFVIDSSTRALLVSQDTQSAELIKPLATGDDIRKWMIRSKDRWLIVTPIGVEIPRYPAIFDHLAQWQDELEKRWDKGNHWWELRPCDYYDAFDKPKIVFPDIAKEPRFAFDPGGFYTNNTTYFIPGHDLYLLGLLNSESIWGYAKERLTVLGDADKGGRLRFFRQFVRELPIPQALTPDRNAIADLVQKCLDARGVGVEEYEKEINERVAHLYGLDGWD